MNVRPGDIARVVHPSQYGKLVQVHQLITGMPYKHPNGHPAMPSCLGAWEVESLGSAFPVTRMRSGVPYGDFSQWAACDDKWLRPLRDSGDDAVDEMLQRTGKPETAAIEWALGVRDVTRS